MRTPIVASLALAGALAAATAGAASAQTALSASDTAFMTQTAQGSSYELMLSELGLERGSSPMVREYAQALVLDHANYNVAMLNLAQKYGAALPLQADAADVKRLSALQAKSGTGFDTAFLTEEARVNADDITQETKELGSTQAADVRSFVQSLQDGDRFHLSLAQQLMHSSST